MEDGPGVLENPLYPEEYGADRGATWQEVANKRKLISQLSLTIERKSAGLDHPAEHNTR